MIQKIWKCFALLNLILKNLPESTIWLCTFFMVTSIKDMELITRDTYGPTKEKFVYIQELVFIQCLAYCLIAFIFKPKGSTESVPWYYYAMAAASDTIAMVICITALEFVAYPTQILCKSCKPLAVLLFDVVFASKRYPWTKYLYTSLIVAGMAIFMYKPTHTGNFDLLTFGIGEVLLLLSLLMDGVTATIQERIRANFETEKYSMMLYMNLFSAIYLSFSILIFNDLMKFVSFVQRYPFVLQRIALLSVAGAFGQVFIFKTVSDFGPLTLSIITTSRKLISVVFSVILFANPFTTNQLYGTIVVFTALFFDGYESFRRENATPVIACSTISVSKNNKKEITEANEKSCFENGNEPLKIVATNRRRPRKE